MTGFETNRFQNSRAHGVARLPCGLRASDTLQAEGVQAGIQNPPFHVKARGQEPPVQVSQVGPSAAPAGCFEHADGAQHVQLLPSGQPPSRPVIHQHQVCRQFSGEQHAGQFPAPQRMLLTQPGQFGGGCRWMHLNPRRRVQDVRRDTASPGHHHFRMDFTGDVNPSKQPRRKLQLSGSAQADQRGSVGNHPHKPSLVVVSQSSRQSDMV